ncbi:MAG: hypothetical protein HUU20_02500 [Pirellulales bacterium]|nr:hypothetical protein [Pirellulales bacterium]
MAALVCCLVFLLLSGSAGAQDRLYEKEPFDRITLDEQNENAVLTVKPIDLPERRVPDPLPPRGKVTVQLVEKPDTAYEVQWQSIAKIELFEQIVLDEARKLAEAKQYEGAYDYFEYLEANAPATPGLNDAICDFLHLQFESFENAKLHENALAMLDEIHRRNPQRQLLSEELGRTIGSLVEQYLAKENHPAARALIESLARKFPQHALVAQWQTRWKDEGVRLLEQAKADLAAGRFRSADEAVRRQIRVWPQTPNAKETAQAVHDKYPRVVVGVASVARDLGPARLADWAARRSSRLVYRTLTEFLGPGTDGGKYQCPVGQMETEELGRRLVFRLKPGLRWSSGDAVLTSYDLARRLLALADPRDRAYCVEWDALLDQVSVADVYRVHADLRNPHVRPEAYLQTPLLPETIAASGADAPSWNGPFVLDARSDDRIVYVANDRYNIASARPKEVVERWFDRGIKAIAALGRREIDVLDRVNPWELRQLRQNKDLVVEPYAAPLVHCLIPNLRRPLPASATFRRALVYGINRKIILEHLLGENPPAGCRVISGPFSAGVSLQDPLAYAYDDTIEPRGYEPRLSLVLAEVARSELAAKDAQGQWKKLPGLVLAHPPHEIARVACTWIRDQLQVLGLAVALKELPPDACRPIPDDVDFVYAELAMWEPVADARRLLSAEGPSGGCSRYLGLALTQLDRAADWLQVSTRLRQIHRIAHDGVAVVPLWQIVDHFAYHRSLAGVGSRPVVLFQNVEAWQPEFHDSGGLP